MSQEKIKLTCTQCGWLGLCVVACPLSDPARMISPSISTAPGIEEEEDTAFEIVWQDEEPTATSDD